MKNSAQKNGECHKCGETIKGEEILPDFEQDKARAVEALVDTIGEEMLIDAFNLPKEAFDKKHQGKQRLSHDYLQQLAKEHFGANGKLAELQENANEQEYATVLNDLGTHMRVVEDDHIRPTALWAKRDCTIAKT